MIDPVKLQAQATELEVLLNKYAPGTPDLEYCRLQLDPLFREIAEAGGQVGEQRDVPCARFSGEGGFEPWPDLLEAYSEFYVTLLDLGDVKIPEEP